jgi:GNAT superfamily N-acetyltransferase
MIHVRPYVSDDRTFVFILAPRLLIGMPPWRDPHRWLTAFQNWITVSIDQHGQKTMVFIAENDHGERLGFATLSHETHFTGEHQASINELATSDVAEGRGVGTALIQACEQWAGAGLPDSRAQYRRGQWACARLLSPSRLSR